MLEITGAIAGTGTWQGTIMCWGWTRSNGVPVSNMPKLRKNYYLLHIITGIFDIICKLLLFYTG